MECDCGRVSECVCVCERGYGIKTSDLEMHHQSIFTHNGFVQLSQSNWVSLDVMHFQLLISTNLFDIIMIILMFHTGSQ